MSIYLFYNAIFNIYNEESWKQIIKTMVTIKLC